MLQRSKHPLEGAGQPRRRWRLSIAALLGTALLLPTAAVPAAGTSSAAETAVSPTAEDALARQTLSPGDGWGSVGAGTTGGVSADEIVDVSTRAELATAVAGNAPKIVRVTGDIDANTTPGGSRLACEDYARDGYDLQSYLRQFDPVRWDGPAEGPQEDARRASSAAQGQQIRLRLGANTTLIGAPGATLTGFNLEISNVSNVIVRNLEIADAYDCFPHWNGDTWKTEWDNLVVSGSTNVWLDHLDLHDGDTVDAEQPEYFGEKFLRHDGLLDVVRAADLVTVSWSRLAGHDKAMLIGNGDSRVSDRGALRVTMHHNELSDLSQRAPRVRFGQVHVYNNVYRVTKPESYQYSWGVGVESSIVARNNTFDLHSDVPAGKIVRNWGGTGIDAAGTIVNGRPTDVLASYNEAHPGEALTGTVAGDTGPHAVIQTAARAADAVAESAGARLNPDWSDPADPAAAGRAVLARIDAPQTTTVDGPAWSATPTGFAATVTDEYPQGTTGGTGGPTVTVKNATDLARWAGADEPATIFVKGAVDVTPFGGMIDVAADKTIVGLASGAAIVGGGLKLEKSDNVIIRNLRFRDSYVAGDWDGKDNDHDGIRVDTSSHVWLDHNEFARLGDGQTDLRKDSTALTLSWNVYRDHNKAIGVGWTDNTLTTLTMHHNWISNSFQRNGSIDNVAAGHLYNNLVEGFAHYGTMSRGASELVVENSVYAHGEDAIVAKDEASRVDSRGNRFTDVRGRKDNTGTTFEPSDHYAYRADPVDDVRKLVTRMAGPLGAPEKAARTVTVALDGSGDYLSVNAAVGAAWRANRRVDIVVEPGVYREVVRIWPGMDGLTVRGSTGEPSDVVITYDVAAGQSKFYGGNFGHTGSPTLSVLADDVTLRALTIENAYDESANGPSQALALRTAGDRIVLDDVRLLGNQDTFLADTPARDRSARVYTRNSYIEGDVDFIYGGATAVFENSRIHSLDRGDDRNNGYVAAPSTVPGADGFLFVDSVFTSDAADGTVHLGRPWHPSSNPNVNPSVIVRDSELGAHIRTPAWSDMGGWPWEDDLLAEYQNTGPGAVLPGTTVEGRPQLSDDEALPHTREAYLTREDGWTPWH